MHACAHLLQSCPTLCDPMDCSLPGSSVHGISQARILEWVAMPSSRGSSRPRDPSRISYVSCIGSRFFTISAAREAPVFSQSGASNPRLKTMLLPIACITCCTPLLARLGRVLDRHQGTREAGQLRQWCLPAPSRYQLAGQPGGVRGGAAP